MKDVPNPGSKEAIDEGCSCPVLDNHYGRGLKLNDSDEPLFWQNENCCLHGIEAEISRGVLHD